MEPRGVQALEADVGHVLRRRAAFARRDIAVAFAETGSLPPTALGAGAVGADKQEEDVAGRQAAPGEATAVAIELI